MEVLALLVPPQPVYADYASCDAFEEHPNSFQSFHFLKDGGFGREYILTPSLGLGGLGAYYKKPLGRTFDDNPIQQLKQTRVPCPECQGITVTTDTIGIELAYRRHDSLSF